MTTGLLEINLRVPPVPSGSLPRERLSRLLDAEATTRKAIALTTPAGYGRTTMLAQWARQCRHRVVWYGIDPEDDEPARFFRRLVSAWTFVQPEVRDTRLNAVLAGMDPDAAEVRAAFVDAPPALGDHTIIVLDDVHLLANDEVVRSLTHILDHLPPMLHLVFSGRSLPPIPLARHLVQGDLLRLDANDLRFSLEETTALLRVLTGAGLRPETIVDLHERLEGWVAGLQLAALSLRSGVAPEGRATLTGRHRFIADYIREEVLAALPDEDVRFLTRTSVLDRLNGPLCDALTDRRDSRAVLDRLEQANLFIQPLDESREWSRFHPLFAEVLREELTRREPEASEGLHRRAARWYLAQGLPDAALRHAVAGDDMETGVAVVDRFSNELLNTGRFHQLERWVACIPPRWKERYPVLGLAEAGLLVLSGALDAGMQRLEDIERRLALAEGAESEWQRARTQSVRCFISCFQGDLDAATYWADQALPKLRDEDVSYRVDIHQALGDSLRGHGRWAEAEAMYRKTLAIARGRMPPYYEPHVYGALADLELLRGHLRAAHGYWTVAALSIDKQENFGLLSYPLIGWVHLRMGELAYEWNDLAGASAALAKGQENAELGGDVRCGTVAALLEGRLGMATGDLERASRALSRAETLLAGAAFPEWTAGLERLRLELWLRRGDTEQAVGRAALLARDGRDERDHVITCLASARVLAVAGGDPEQVEASRILAHVLDIAGNEGREGIRLEALAVHALLLHRRGSDAAAMLSLEESLRLGEREGVIRVFVDLGAPMLRLLRAARARHMMRAYVDQLIAAFGEDAAGDGMTLPEPLTPREMEVLQRMAAGLTNEEIAATLFISPETVKKHASSIFGKLGVGNRTEAAARARALGLLSGD